MNQTTVKTPGEFKFKIPVIALMACSLLGAGAAALQTLVSTVVSIVDMISYGDFQFFFVLKVLVLGGISLVLRMAPAALLLAYMLFFSKNEKMTVFVPVAYAAVSATYLLNYLLSLRSSFYYIKEIVESIRHGYFEYMFSERLFSIFTDMMTYGSALLVGGAFVLAVISALKGMNNKWFILIPTALGAVSCVWPLLNFFGGLVNFVDEIEYVTFRSVFHLLMSPVSQLGTFALFVGLLLFGFFNTIPCVIGDKSEPETVETEETDPEQTPSV